MERKPEKKMGKDPNNKKSIGKKFDDRKFRDKKPIKKDLESGQRNPVDYPGGLSAGKKLCSNFGKCGGCQLLSLTYEEQKKRKEQMVKELLGPFGPVEPFIGMEDPFHYRNKVHAVFGTDRKGNAISGVYKAYSHEIVPVDSCLLEDQRADAIIVTIRGLLKSFKIRPYDEDRGFGLLRHVLVRTGHVSGQILVVLVTTSPVFPSKNNFVKVLREKHPEITTIVQNINDKDTSMVLGTRDIVLYGKGYIEDTLCGKTFRISPQSFYQINSVQTEKLYSRAVEYAGLTGKETVLDAYCGIGTIGLIASDHAGKVIGVELNPDAVKDAVRNAKANGAENIVFYEKDAGKFMTQLAQAGQKLDVLFMDPPRSGSSQEFLDAVGQLKPKKIVYISCEITTQVRDLKVLKQKGYQVVKGVGVDMFPMTNNCETVVLLSKGEIDSKKIRVEFSMEGMDMSGFQNDATYGQIKERVLEQTGLKVSSLYIAQVKQKHGIIERENYNKAKSENVRQPQCPPEKEQAIEEALKYFGMIK